MIDDQRLGLGQRDARIFGLEPRRLLIGVGGFVALVEHAVGAGELHPALEILGIGLQLDREPVDHAADHLLAFLGRHLRRPSPVLGAGSGGRGEGGRRHAGAARRVGDARAQPVAQLRVRNVRGELLPAVDGGLRVAGLRLGERQIIARRGVLRVARQRRGEGLLRARRDDALGGEDEHLAIGRGDVGAALGEHQGLLIGIGALLPLAERRRAARQQQPLLGVIGMRREILLERSQDAGDVSLPTLGGGQGALRPASGVGLVRRARRAQREINSHRRGGQQQRQSDGEHRTARAARRRGLRRRVGGEEPALDLESCRRGLVGIDEAAPPVALQLLELVQIDGAVERRALRRGARALHQRQHHRRDDDEGNSGDRQREQHQASSLSSCVSRWRSASVSGAGSAVVARRRRR